MADLPSSQPGFELPRLHVPERFVDDEHYLQWEISRLHTIVDSYHHLLEAADPVAACGDLALFNQAVRQDVRTARRRSALGFDQQLARRFELTELDEEILLIAIAQSMSETLRHHMLEIGNIQGDAVTVGFVSELVRPSLDSRLSRVRWTRVDIPMIEAGILELAPPPGNPDAVFLDWRVRAPHYVVHAARGMATVDDRLARFADLDVPRKGLEDIVLTTDNAEWVNNFLRAFSDRSRRPNMDGENWVLLIAGPRRAGKTLLTEVIASAFQRPLFRIDVPRLAHDRDPVGRLDLALQNAAFFQSVLHVVQPEGLEPNHALYAPLFTAIERYPGLVVVEPRKADDMDPAFDMVVTHSLAMPRPQAEARVSLWELHMPRQVKVAENLRLPDLGSAYDLTGGQIQRATRWALRRASSGGPSEVEVAQDDLVEGARNQLFSRLGRYADRRQVNATLDDLVLADEVMDQVMSLLNAAEARHRVMNDWGFGSKLARGKGLVSLFCGEPGTGKTLCAEILANQLGLQLDIVSIPKIVSKWVGETERNIQQIFAEARASDTVLLFDEADSLFAKRVKVERAQDHFQNMEVNMLLQEIERFDGIVLLTTNLEVNMDKAFQRRILYKIEFPMPEAEERERIWQALMPSQTPLAGDVDYWGLAERFELSGGQIKNAIVLAAYESYPDPVTHMALADAAMVQARAAGMLAQQPPVFEY